MTTLRNKFMGTILGQVVGDALGSQLEFKSAATIEHHNLSYLAHEMVGSPVWGTSAGQITDDSEMAIAALSSISDHGGYSKEGARAAYIDWLRSGPFDCGMTIGGALRTGIPSTTSRSNGSLMRCSTIALWGSTTTDEATLKALQDDARITHLDPVVVDSTVLYGMTIRYALTNDCTREDIFDYAKNLAQHLNVHEIVHEYLRRSEHARPADTDNGYQAGYCMVAFQHAFYSLVSNETFAEAVSNTILTGGDTDTNAAIVGALLGSVVGSAQIPSSWTKITMSCTPHKASPQPRPERFHFSNLIQLTEPIFAALTTKI